MPKAEVGSIKDIGKRIKAKGLQKLKFYCQMCSKQCRDANGFKCHLTSDSHLRQMKIFSENAVGYMDQYSKDFLKMFLDTLRMRHSTSKVNANNVYQEVIRDKHHIHMNSTIWASLSDFCKYLGKVGKCTVEETERGWYVSYIERDVSKMARHEALQKRLESEKDAELAFQQRIEIQRIEAAKLLDRAGGVVHVEATKLLHQQQDDDDDDENDNNKPTKPVQLALHNINAKKTNKKSGGSVPLTQLRSVFGDDSDDDDEIEEVEAVDQQKQQAPTNNSSVSSNNNIQMQPAKLPDENQKASKDDRKRPQMEESKGRKNIDDRKIDADASHSKNKKSKKNVDKQVEEGMDKSEVEPWLYRDIVVRIITKKLADGEYFRRKAVVDSVHDDGYTAEVEVAVDTDYDVDDRKKGSRKDNNGGGGDNAVVIRIDQDDLETVTPKHTGEAVRIVRGKHRGKRATVVELDKKKYCAVLKLKDCTILDRIDYDDFSKIA